MGNLFTRAANFNFKRNVLHMKKVIFISGITLLLMGVVAFRPDDNKAKPGLLSYYTFNGNLSDRGLLKQDGINNGAVFCTDRFGKPNSAISFDGNQHYVEIPASKGFDLNVPAFSISCWVNLDTAVMRKTVILLAKGVPGKQRKGAFITYQQDLKTLLLESWYGHSESAGAIMSIPPERNQWIHIVVTRSGITTIMYFNGAMHMQQNKPDLADMTNDAPLYLGGWPKGGGMYFTGAIDDLRIYKEALTDKQVADLYSSEK